MRRFIPLALCLLLLPSSAVLAQKNGFPPNQETMQKIRAKTEELGRALASLKEKGTKDPILADVEVYHRAAQVIVRNNDFHFADSAAWTLEVLDLGLARAKQAADGKTPWTKPGTHTIRAYRSRVDGSVQPYAVTFPAEMDKDAKNWRIDVVLHGRSDQMTEVSFLRGHKDRAVGKGSTIVIDVFGRGNNAYRWAGETDVFEAMESVFRERMPEKTPADHSRIVLRGFSMGGAGTWHLGLQHPDRWCVIGPGAGFSNTRGLAADHPKIWDRCLTIYDAVDYAGNAFNVPIVAYSGGMDAQKTAADNVEARLKILGLSDRMTHLIAPDQKHSFPAEYVKKADALWSKFVVQGRDPNPKEIRFTTYTLKYPKCDWVEILGLDQHYQEAHVHAKQTADGFEATTKNVRRLLLTDVAGKRPSVKVKIDGDEITAKQLGNIGLEKKNGHWDIVAVVKGGPALEKVHGLQGPIDDAFTDGFLCVQGTQKTWHPATQSYVDKDLARFTHEWSKYMHGDMPIKKDTDVTADDIAGKNLILFGDPASNSLIAKTLDRLPLRWTKDTLELAGKKYDPAGHLPVMIYPNPLNPKKYVVLNSGHTFHEPEFKATNAFLFPRLGDYAVLKLAAAGAAPLQVQPVEIGLFDEFWKIPQK